MPNGQQVLGLVRSLERAIAMADFTTALEEVEEWPVRHPFRWTLDALDGLRLNGLASEVYGYFGRDTEAVKMVGESWTQCEKWLKELVDANASDVPGLYQEFKAYYELCVVTGVQRAHGYYRKHDYDSALECLELCEKALSKLIVNGGFRSHAVLGCVCHAIGLVYREKGDPHYNDAKQYFSDAVDHFSLTAADSAAGQVETPALLRYRIASSLVRLGWIVYTEGQLGMARPFVAMAQTLLAETPAHLTREYVNVVHACIEMSAHGDEFKVVDRAIDTLGKAHEVFASQTSGHEGYKASAAHELALANIRRAVLSHTDKEKKVYHVAAEESIDELLTYANSKQDSRWRCKANIARSRLHRCQGRYDDAVRCAKDAFADANDSPFLKIDALIARGEGHFEMRRVKSAPASFSLAASDFKKARFRPG